MQLNKYYYLITLLSIFVENLQFDEVTKSRYGIEENIKIKDILDYQSISKEEDSKRFPGKVLAYVTTWNSKGYDTSEFMCQQSRLDIVSPVWFQLKPDSENGRVVKLTGQNSINKRWMSRIHNTSCIITPRIIFEDWDINQIRDVFVEHDEKSKRVSRFISNFITKMGFNGTIIELDPVLAKVFYIQTRNFLYRLHELITSSHKTLGVVHSDYYQWNDIELTDIAGSVDYFTVNAYDNFDGGIAPYNWMNGLIRKIPIDIRKSFLIGVNFYGYKFVKDYMQALTGNDFLKSIQNGKYTVEWNKNTKEHNFKSSTNVIIYPTAMSLYYRMQLICELNAGGIAIWELGQGTDQLIDII